MNTRTNDKLTKEKLILKEKIAIIKKKLDERKQTLLDLEYNQAIQHINTFILIDEVAPCDKNVLKEIESLKAEVAKITKELTRLKETLLDLEYNEAVQHHNKFLQSLMTENECLQEIKDAWNVACKTHQVEIINKLLRWINTIPSNAMTDENETSLRPALYRIGMISAIQYGDLGLLQTLWNDCNDWIKIARQSFYHSANELFNTHTNALIYAIYYDQEQCALWLLAQGVDANSLYATEYGKHLELQDTALTFAIKKGMTNLAIELIQQSAWVGQQCLDSVKTWKNENELQVGEHPSPIILEPLCLAAKQNNKAIVHAILKRAVSPLLQCEGKNAFEYTTDLEIKQLLQPCLTQISSNTLFTNQRLNQPASSSNSSELQVDSISNKFKWNASSLRSSQ